MAAKRVACWPLDALVMERLAGKTWEESKNMWSIAGPAIATAIFQFSLGFVTAAFVGHLGAAELAAVSIVQNVVEGFAYGILVIALTPPCPSAVVPLTSLLRFTHFLKAKPAVDAGNP